MVRSQPFLSAVHRLSAIFIGEGREIFKIFVLNPAIKNNYLAIRSAFQR